MALEAGASLGRYRIERRLGAGAMGEVYLAQDPHIERPLALKTVRIGDADAAEVAERGVRLMREAKAAGRLVHPHVVTLFDAGETGGIFFLAFEYVAGPDLAGRQRLAPPLTLGEVLRIGRQAAEGLDAAHRQGIVHRDIKPSNILLDSHGQVKISDFGIAKMLGQGTELTQTGSVVGSPHYLSPEQIRGEELDGRSDVFSLGVVLYELLTRQRPFEGETITTLVYQILAREPNSIAGLRPGLPDRVEQTVVRMLAKDRDARFATAREVAIEIGACERELSADVLAAPAASMPGELDETARLPASSPTPKPTPPPAAWSMPMPASSADATGPTRLSPRTPTPMPPGAGTPPRVTVIADTAPAAEAGMAPPPLPSYPPVGYPPASAGGVPPGSSGSLAVPPMGAGSGAHPQLGAPAMAPVGPASYPPSSAAPARRRFPWVIVIVLLGLGLLTLVGGVGAYYWLRGGWGRQTAATTDGTTVAQRAANETLPATLPGSAEPAATEPPAQPVATQESDSPYPQQPTASLSPVPTVAVEAVPSRAPAEVYPTTAPAPTSRKSEPPPRATVAPTVAAVPAPRPTATAYDSDSPRRPEPRPEPPARPSVAPAPPVPPPAPAEPEPDAPSQRFDREMASTLALKFKVEPEDAVVSFKEEGDRRFTVIGRANDYPADKKKGPSFDLPGAGTYYLRLYAEGREFVYKLDAQPGAQPTTISYVLVPKRGRG